MKRGWRLEAGPVRGVRRRLPLRGRGWRWGPLRASSPGLLPELAECQK